MSRERSERNYRLDELLVRREMATGRSQAQALIRSGKVRSGTVVLDKPGKSVPESIPLEIESPPPYVSRGGRKLARYFEVFPWEIEGKEFLDIGASTGGFTDYLLQHGARSGVCVDVGRAQLHGKLLNDPRVTNLEKVNARRLGEANLPSPTYPLIVIDVSFISLRLILPPAWERLERHGLLVALVKPQFESGRKEASRGRGVIRDTALQERILAEITEFALCELPGARVAGTVESPMTGADGNREFLLGLTKSALV